jgi:2'-5' RNA ligase
VAKERLKSPRARLFLALDLPDDIREGIVAWQRRELVDEAMRVTPPQNLHLTLVFLGFQRERDIDSIAKLVEGIDGDPAEVRLEPEPVGVGRSKRRPGLYALDAPSRGAVRLHAELSDRLERAGLYKPEKRAFWPHLTVARVRPERRGSKQPMQVSSPPGPLPDAVVHPFDSIRVSLYRSNLRPQGAEYVSLATTELSPPKRGTGDEKVS